MGTAGNQSLSPITKRLDPGDPPMLFGEYVIIGTYSFLGPTFVGHLALLSKDAILPNVGPIDVWHSGPPIVAGPRTKSGAGANLRTSADLISDIRLTSEERNAMKNWRAKVDKERRPLQPFQQYIIDPPIKWVMSELGRPLRRRFSCVGFVIDCYASAGIRVLGPTGALPAVSEISVAAAYPDLIRIEQSGPRVRARYGYKGREDLGLIGPGPWRIALAGYVFHALFRATAERPRPREHVPASEAEAYYP